MEPVYLLTMIVAWFVPKPSLAADPVSLEETSKSYARSWEKGSPEKMLSFYESSDDVHAVISSGLTFTGRDEIKKMFQLAFEEADFRNVKLPKLKIHQEGNAAWATCRFQAEITSKQDGKKYRFQSHGIFVLRRLNGEWKIASEHFSPIQGVERIQPWDETEAPAAPARKGTPVTDPSR